jgi:uncharacterized protein YndB with AHSA1/START domain
MITFTNTVNIDRPIDEVFAYLADLEHTPEWNWAITETKKVTPGPASVGTRYRQIRSVPQVSTEELEIIALDPDRRIEIRATLADLPAHLVYELDQVSTGTSVTNTVEIEPQGVFRLIGPVVGGRAKNAVAENLSKLKELLEAG